MYCQSKVQNPNLPNMSTGIEDLPSETLQHVFSFVSNDGSFASICRVSRLWHEAGEFAWEKYCKDRGFLNNPFWSEKGKDWKWICKAKMNKLIMDTRKEGVGHFEGTYPDKWIYEGEWKNDMPNGIGFKKDSKRGEYVGHWKDGRLEGHGIYKDLCGDKYDGNWVDGTKDGDGVYSWGEGRWKNHLYVGKWKKGRLEGQGRYSFPSGTYYDGEWLEDNMHGKGTYFYHGGDEYHGDWIKDKRYGFGVFKFVKHQCVYEGEFKGSREGHGVLTWSNGDRYVGQWHKNSRLGPGFLYCNDGRVFEQHWSEQSGIAYSFVEPQRFPDASSGTSMLFKSSDASLPKNEEVDDGLDPENDGGEPRMKKLKTC